MRRWNGWGDEADETHLGPGGRRFLETRIGTAKPVGDAKLDDVVAAVVPSRLSAHPLLSLGPELRVAGPAASRPPD
jgi:alkyldihydroxyacetonephosphate synthase